MFDENKLVYFTHKKHKKEITSYYFVKVIDEKKEIRGEIKVTWNKQKGVNYELMLVESSEKVNLEYTYKFISIIDEIWFKENLNIIIDLHKNSFGISSIFRGDN